MSASFRGVAVIYGAKGGITIDGTAVGSLNSSVEVSRPMDHIVKLTGSDGTRKGYVIPEDRRKISITFTPTAASLATIAAASAVPAALALMVIAAADVADVNGTYVIDENCSAKFTNTGPQETQITATRYTDDANTADVAAVIS
ncbi:MAG: hypothetical protein EBS05_10095 [Proteobacteria bacterium]|nr:hypothetical protein [Pseudomonadota bacterium]